MLKENGKFNSWSVKESKMHSSMDSKAVSGIAALVTICSDVSEKEVDGLLCFDFSEGI